MQVTSRFEKKLTKNITKTTYDDTDYVIYKRKNIDLGIEKSPEKMRYGFHFGNISCDCWWIGLRIPFRYIEFGGPRKCSHKEPCYQ